MRTQITKTKFPTGFESPIMFFGYLLTVFSFIVFMNESFNKQIESSNRSVEPKEISLLNTHVDDQSKSHCEGGDSGVVQEVEHWKSK